MVDRIVIHLEDGKEVELRSSKGDVWVVIVRRGEEVLRTHAFPDDSRRNRALASAELFQTALGFANALDDEGIVW